MIAGLLAALVVGALYVGARSAESLGGRPRRADRTTYRTGDGDGHGSWADGSPGGDGECGGDGGGCD